MIRHEHGLTSVVPPEALSRVPTYPEEIRAHALKMEHDRIDREHNAGVVLKYLEDVMKAHARGVGSWAKEDKAIYEDAESKAKKFQMRELHTKRTIDKCIQAHGSLGQGAVRILTDYATKYEGMSRMRAQTIGIQGMSKVMQLASNPNLHEFDQEASQWTFLPQIVGRVMPKFNHTVVALPSIKSYKPNRAAVHASIGPDPTSAKEIALQVLNGMPVPPSLSNNEFLFSVRKEGRFLRWLASSLNPTLHTHLLEEGKKTWPENTCLFYLWTGPEAWATYVQANYSITLSPRHLSLHYDGLKIIPEAYTVPRDIFIKELEGRVLTETGYAVTMVRKKAMLSLDILKSIGGVPVDERCDTVLRKQGNCIPAAIYFSMGTPAHIVSLLRKVNTANKRAADEGVRTYRECQALCKCTLRPTSFQALEPGKDYVVHMENGGKPKAVRLSIQAGGTCMMTDQGHTWPVPLKLLVLWLPRGVDSKSLRFFEILAQNIVALDGAQEDALLDLRAGGGGDVSAADRFLTILDKEVEDYKVELKATKYRAGRAKTRVSKRGKARVCKPLLVKKNMCKLCPKRGFQHPNRLRGHVDTHHQR